MVQCSITVPLKYYRKPKGVYKLNIGLKWVKIFRKDKNSPRYSLFVTFYSLLIICYFLLVTRYLLFFFSLLVICYFLLVTRYLLLFTRYSLFVVFYSLLVYSLHLKMISRFSNLLIFFLSMVMENKAKKIYFYLIWKDE